jgi:gamma-glutamylcyclotransferase (GGCT)/AIG2-like uncharacterized protein YtfP
LHLGIANKAEMQSRPTAVSGSSLFVYGSLLSPEVLQLVVGRVPDSEAAVLEGYACYYVEGATFPGIIAEKSAATCGRVLKDLTEAELTALDRYEDSFYQRLAVTVVVDGSECSAMAYVVPAVYKHILSEQRWTWDEFERIHLAQYVARMS